MPGTYEAAFRSWDEPFRYGMEVSISAGAQYMAGVIPYLLVPAIIGAGMLAATGSMSMSRLVSWGFRIAIVMYLIVGGAYASQIAGFIRDSIPNEIAAALSGSAEVVGARQFDNINDSAAYFTGELVKQTASAFKVPQALAVIIARFAFQLVLYAIFTLWLISKLITTLALVMGAFVVFTLIFDNTKHIFQGWVGMITGCLLYQIATSVIMNVMYAGMRNKLAAIISSSASTSLEMQIDQLFEVVAFFGGNAFLMIMIPAVCGFAGGHASSNAVNGAVSTGMRAFTSSAQSMQSMANSMRSTAKQMRRAKS